MTQKTDKRFITVSNRLPVVIRREEDEWTIAPGSGGLVTALAPVMRKNGGLWIGWAGCDDDAPLEKLFGEFAGGQNYRLAAIPLSAEEIELYYWNFANGALWPLFHDLLGHCNFDLKSWLTYDLVNQRFAARVAELHDQEEFVWVHDYQLMRVALHLRALGFRPPLAYFHHIPFPPFDLFRRLPWKEEIIRGLLEYDLLGFQTLHDRRNFVNTVATMIPEAEVLTRQRHFTLLSYNQKMIKVGHYPISIDFKEFDAMARSRKVDEAAWLLHENLQERQLILGIDRLDYTKGIPERFLAFERALEKYPEMKRRVSLVQVVVPSRTLVPDYQDLKGVLDQLVGRINGRFGESCWQPIHYIFRSLDQVQLMAHYRTSEIALITPLRDGMNLVAKEYCACSVEDNGVLILSELAGAAAELGRFAIPVNPYDLEKTADAIHRAFTMAPEERRERMRALRNQIRRHDVHHWVNIFVGAMPLDNG